MHSLLVSTVDFSFPKMILGGLWCIYARDFTKGNSISRKSQKTISLKSWNVGSTAPAFPKAA